MKNLLWCCGVGAALWFAGGCCQTTMRCEKPYAEFKAPEGGRAIVNISVRNDGYYFFGLNALPFITGNIRRPNAKDYRFFRHTVYENANRALMIRRVRGLGGNDLARLEHVRHEYFPWWYLFLVEHKTITSRAVGVYDPNAPETRRGRVFFDD